MLSGHHLADNDQYLGNSALSALLPNHRFMAPWVRMMDAVGPLISTDMGSGFWPEAEGMVLRSGRVQI
jgi:hypothetical protein